MRAVVYIRMSTSKQEDSPERQRSQVAEYAKRNGFQIVREFIDEGIPGDEVESRPQFMEMLRLAKRNQFDVILCDDKDRFGRFDTITNGAIVAPLRTVGVWLETVAQGKIDWTSFSGRISDAVLQEAKKLESQATSRRVWGSILLKLNRGEWVPAIAPFGYRAEKPEGKRVLIVDEDRAKIVRWMFDQCATKGASVGAIANELSARKVLVPTGNGAGKKRKWKTKFLNAWDRQTVRKILKNPVYLGQTRYNAVNQGGYSEFDGKKIVTHDQKGSARPHDKSQWIVKPATHVAIITPELFEKAQAALAGNRKNTTPKPAGTSPFLLSKVIVCGHCQAPMTGSHHKGHRVYRCSSYGRMGKAVCHRNQVREALVFDATVAALQAYCALQMDGFRAEVEAEIEATRAIPPEQLATLRREIDTLNQTLKTGRLRFLSLPEGTSAEVVSELRETLEELTAERQRNAERLESLERGTLIQDKEALIKEAEEELWNWRESLATDDPNEMRTVIRESVLRIELLWEHTQGTKIVTSCLKEGAVLLRPQRVQTSHLETLGL
jgi:site-specific DNA recombinase